MRRMLLPVAALLLALPAAAVAQDAQFAPVTMTFDGTDALSFAPSSALDINGAGTVEMWVQANWQGNAGYDPAILSYQGPNGPRLAVLLTGDAKALGVYAGQYYDKVPYDFADGQLHHIALIVLGEEIIVMIDGEVRETLGFGMAELPATDFTVGSLGGYSPFIGEIGQIRIWDEPLDPETIADFAWRPLAADGPNAHPEIASLAAVSAFANPETGGFIFFGPSEDADVTADEEAPVDDGELGLDDPDLQIAE